MNARPVRRLVREHPGLTPEVARAHADGAGRSLVDLSSGHNPYGPPPDVLAAVRGASVDAYPEPDARSARTRIAAKLCVDPERVVLGNGATELLWSCARALIGPGTALLSIEPGYPELPLAARQLGARVLQWRSVERTGHAIDLAQVAELIRLEHPALVSLCAPGSPTGASVPFAQLTQLAHAFPDTMFVVNQTWLPLSDDFADLECVPAPNVVCVRSFSKALSIPGVRVGYLIAAHELAARIENGRPTFSTSAAAQAAATRAMAQDEFLARSRAALRIDRERLQALLSTHGLHYTPSVAPFVLVRVARASEVAAALLQRHGIAVRDATAFGLPDHLRVCALAPEAGARLSSALAQELARFGLVRGRQA